MPPFLIFDGLVFPILLKKAFFVKFPAQTSVLWIPDEVIANVINSFVARSPSIFARTYIIFWQIYDYNTF
jgi:hypothetical protein